MGKLARWAVAVAFCAACSGQVHSTGGNQQIGTDAGADAGPPPTGGPDAGPTNDGGTPSTDGGSPNDGGTPSDGGTPTDGGTPADGGTPGGISFGGPGPWPLTNQVYGAAQGIQEQPIVGVSTDETQNLWVATSAAVYLMRPGDSKFTRYDVSSGLHLASNPVTYCDRDYSLDAQGRAAGLPEPDRACPILGGADPAGISEIAGGGPNEVFVGYHGSHDWSNPNDGTWADPYRHTGMLDRLRVNPDLTVQIDRLQMVSGVSVAFWHNKDVMRLVYDHFKHPHELYVGTNHGVDRMTPDKFTKPVVHPGYPGEETWAPDTYAWMADHLHPQACSCGPCPNAGEGPLLLGDWRGLAVTANGNLLVGGRWAAGKIIWTQENYTSDGKGWFQRSGADSFEFALGDGYGGGCSFNRPVFCVAREGDTIAISAVAETPDGLQWFASGPYGYQPDKACPSPYTGQVNAGDRDLGVASFDPKTYQFTYYSPTADIGMGSSNVRDMVALPDGRLVFASTSSGLVFWDPATKKSVAMHAGNGIPDDRVQRLELDTMVNPPALHVSTYSGAVVLRQFP